jgi:hypothetical protein
MRALAAVLAIGLLWPPHMVMAQAAQSGSPAGSSVLSTGGGQALLDPSDTVLLLLDYQAGLFQTVKDISEAELRANTVALAKLATLLKIPVITEGELAVDGARLSTKDQGRIDVEAPLTSTAYQDTRFVLIDVALVPRLGVRSGDLAGHTKLEAVWPLLRVSLPVHVVSAAARQERPARRPAYGQQELICHG